jgi:hypothetical protein
LLASKLCRTPLAQGQGMREKDQIAGESGGVAGDPRAGQTNTGSVNECVR